MASKYDEIRKNRIRQGQEAKKRVMSGIYRQPVSSPASEQTSKYDLIRNRSRDLVGSAPVEINQDVRSQMPDLFNPFQQMQDLERRLQSPLPAAPRQEDAAQRQGNQYLAEQAAKRDAQDPKNPALKWLKDNTIDAAAGAMDRFLLNNPVGRFVNRTSRAGAEAVGVDTEAAKAVPLRSTGSKVVDTIADFGGAAVGTLTNPSNISQSLVTGPLRAGQALSQRLAPKTGPLAQRAIEGATAGAIQGGVIGGVRGETDLGEMAANVGLGAATGAIADPLVYGVGRGISRLLNRNAPSPAPQEVLALPEPRVRGNINRTVTDEVIYNADTRPLGLPEPNIQPPTTARIARRTNPYREQYESLIQEAQQMQREGRIRPGFEIENLQSMWSQRAGRDGVTLDELIRLAYPSRETRITPDLVQRARYYQQAREVAGVPLPVRSFSERYQPGELGQAVPPIKRLRRLPGDQSLNVESVSPGGGQARQPALNASVENVAPRVDAKPQNPPILNSRIQPARESVEPKQPVNEVADDIEMPQPDEVTPRVRDRLSALADSWIEEARMQLRNKQNLGFAAQPGTPDAVILAKLGAGYMLKGTVKLADFTEVMVREFGDGVKPYIRQIFKLAKEEYKRINKQIESEELGLIGFEAQELKDLSNLNLNTADVYRNFRKVFGNYYEPVKRAVLDPFDEAKGAYAQEQKNLTDKLYNEIVKGLGIRKGSKESALVQRYGEGRINLDQLKQEAPRNWKQIVRADQWFRQQYNDLINRVNETVSRIYPNRPEKLVPYRKDYYRHFQELKGWGGLVNLFDTTSAKISPSLSGVSPYTQPKTKWASFKQKRGLGEFTDDAVGGFLDYIPAASYAIHIDPHITTFRNLAKRLAEDTEQTANINNFIKFLNNFANDLAGKTSPIDRWVEEIGGRKALQILTRVNNRVKSNVILGNVRSTLSQLANIPNGIAYGGIDSPAGAIRTISSIFAPNEAMNKSAFLRERYIDKDFRRFNQKFWEQPRRFAEFMMETADRVGTSFIWNTAYAKAIRQKVPNPVKFADEQTRRLIGGRGIGEQPLLIKSKMFNVVAPFQLEVNNLWRVMKDFVDEKRFGSLVTLFAANWLLNKAFEQATGSGVVFDPIDAIYDAAIGEDMNLLQRGGRVAGEVLSNVPFGQTIATLYPEYGTNLYGIELPTRKELFGEKDPTRFGSGLLAAGAVTDPLFKFVLPFGGNQLRKSTQGLDALLRRGSYTENILTTGPRIENPKLKFPIEPNAGNIIRGALFGPYATNEGQAYTQNERRPLSEKQTQEYLNSSDHRGFYEELMRIRRENTEKRKQQELKNK